MAIPYDSALGVHPQAEGFTRHEAWDFAATSRSEYPLLQHFPYFDLYRKQVVKQADLVLAMQLHPDAFSAEQKARNFAYYERLTVRDSSLSAATQAVVAAEVGHLQLAHDYLAETALIDLDDTEHNVRDGLHLAALAGAWTAAVGGLGGLRGRSGTLAFAPRLPPAITRLAFTVSCAGSRPCAPTYPAARATYLLVGGPPMQISHHGEPVTLIAGQPLTMDHTARPGGQPGQPAARPGAGQAQPGTGTVPRLAPGPSVVQHRGAAEPAVREVSQRLRRFLHRVGHSRGLDAEPGSQGQELLAVPAGIRGDAPQLPFLEQLVGILDRGNVGQPDPGDRQRAAAV